MPTWRAPLSHSQKAFLSSDFYHSLISFINNEQMLDELEKLGYTGKDYEGFSNFVELKKAKIAIQISVFKIPLKIAFFHSISDPFKSP